MKYIYMNHRIKQKNPRKPVIVCQQVEGGGLDGIEEANEFEIRVNGAFIGRVKFSKGGLDVCETHAVKAWIEFVDAVDVRPAGQPARKPASAKLPNKQVDMFD